MLLPALHARRTLLPLAVLPFRPPAICCDRAPWTNEETWTLVDSVPAFTAGTGTNAATFWTALVASSAVLGRRTVDECMEHAVEQNITVLGPEPMLLDDWSRMPDGRYTGTLGGRSVWLSVEMEARLEADPRPTASYVQTLAGRVYELGRSAAATGEPLGSGAQWGGVVPTRAPLLLSLLIAGLVGLVGGTAAQQLLLPAAAPESVAPLPPTRAYPAVEKVALTVAEQARARPSRPIRHAATAPRHSTAADALRHDGAVAPAAALGRRWGGWRFERTPTGCASTA